MKLDLKDRFIIANQLKILEALYPDEASSYAIQRTAFEAGYESHYSWAIMDNISSDVLSEDDTKEVRDTLDMFCTIQHAYKALNKKTKIEDHWVKFKGYDGNGPVECKFLGYARYIVVELERFQDILKNQGEDFSFNSHCPMRATYRRMLNAWRQTTADVKLPGKFELSKDELSKILEAAAPPKESV